MRVSRKRDKSALSTSKLPHVQPVKYRPRNRGTMEYMWRVVKGFFVTNTENTDSVVYKGIEIARKRQASSHPLYRARTVKPEKRFSVA